jgi:hypothetical protein
MRDRTGAQRQPWFPPRAQKTQYHYKRPAFVYQGLAAIIKEEVMTMIKMLFNEEIIEKKQAATGARHRAPRGKGRSKKMVLPFENIDRRRDSQRRASRCVTRQMTDEEKRQYGILADSSCHR